MNFIHSFLVSLMIVSATPLWATTPPLPNFPLLTFTPPQPERFELPNGLVVFLLEDHELPLIRVQALIHTGSQYEPADKVGLSSLFAESLTLGGSLSFPMDTVQKALDKTAGEISFASDLESTNGTFLARSQDFDTLFPIFTDLLQHPQLDKGVIETARNKAYERLRRLNDEPQELGRREFRKILYGPYHPYARAATPTSLKKISRADLLAWHDQFIHPNTTFLAISGDFKASEIKQKLLKLFGTWARKTVETPTIPLVEANAGGVYYISRNISQTQIRIGHIGIPRQHPDEYAWEVFNELWGGSSSSELFRVIRTQKGLAYSVASTYWQPANPGIIVAICQTRGGQTAQAIQSMLDIERRVITAPFSDKEIADAKESIRNRFISNFTSSNQIVSRIMELEFNGYPKNYLDTYTTRIATISRADLQRVASTHLKLSQNALLVVGDLSTFDKPLSTFGKPLRIEVPDYTQEQ